MIVSDVLVVPCLKTSCSDLIPWLLDAATLQEAHPFHRDNWPDWVPGWGRFREHANLLAILVKASENKDREKTKERDQAHADTLLAVNLNANYIIMRSIHEKDESLLHNVGYQLKEKTKKGVLSSSLRDSPLHLKTKHGDDPGSVIVIFERDPAARLNQLQICKGEPVGEESWGDYGFHKGCRVLASNLDRANWYYFRVRCHGDNEVGPWSAPVGIIVL